VPSSLTPPIAGGAIDPPSLRPPIDDAAIERIDAASLHSRLAALKSDGYTMLLDIGAADYPLRTPRFDVVYHLLKLDPNARSIEQVGKPQRMRLLCGVDGANPRLPTASDLWRSANWAEREIYDLFGIVFDGHPDLRRIQMPHNWEGHPLRKDYPLRGPARERSPRPAFALKSNVAAGTPPSRDTLAALQEQRKKQ
jgi:NADH:ubiquinone oxidoreductase subunit C